MKNIKFKVLIMFMLLLVVGCTICSVSAVEEKVKGRYCKTSDLYEKHVPTKTHPVDGAVIKEDDNSSYIQFKMPNGKLTQGITISEGGVLTENGKLFKYMVEDYIIKSSDGDWIKREDWDDYMKAYAQQYQPTITYADFRDTYGEYWDSVTYEKDNLEVITKPAVKDEGEAEEDLNKFWTKAFEWFNASRNTNGMGVVTDGFMKGATNIIKMVGNMIFIVVTSILGAKYIWGSADAKYSVKNSLFGLVLAAVVFYGWDSISYLIGEFTNSTIGNNIETTTKSIYTYILYFINIAAIGGIIFLGIKYLLASAEGKSQLKMNLGPAFLGIIMVYATISFLNTILGIFLG